MEKKKDNSKMVFVAIGLVVGGFALLACTGILAAIAIPSFIKYTQKSKAAEAQMMTHQMANYAAQAYAMSCAFPEALAPTTDPSVCCGEKCAPEAKVPEIWATNVTGLWEPTYYAYSAVPSGEKKLTIVAEADFNCDGVRQRISIEVTGTGSGDACDASIGAAITENELD